MIEKTTKTLEEIDAYEYPELLAKRVIKDNPERGYSLEDAHAIVREAKRYLYIYAKTHASMVAPSETADHGWHAMLMFTKWYRDFTRGFLGVFIDHNPVDKEAAAGGGGEAVDTDSMYAKTKSLYAQVIGEQPDPKYWP